VLRLHSAAASALGADHGREAQLQNAAAAAGVAPRVAYLDPHGHFMVSELIAGRLWTEADFSDPRQLAKLGETFRRLHEVPPPIAAPFDLAARLRGFSERIARSAPEERPLLPATLFHSDPKHSNIIESGGGLLLIDWEYAAVGDPLYDVACVLAYYPQSGPHARVLLDSSGLATQTTLAMLDHATWLYVLLSFLWERIRRLEAGPGAGAGPASPAD
jgi:thiamine kinase